MDGEKEGFESLTIRLYKAAIKGDVSSLHNLDPHILDRCCIEKSGRFTQSPLHVAANLGHLEFVRKILEMKPCLAEELDDIKQQSPLHLAASNGQLKIVEALLDESPNMCLSRDQNGRNPLHIAAIKGQIDVLDALRLARPQAAYERTNATETVLHLCVKYNQPEVLEHLIRAMDDIELLNAKDSFENTILHLAVEAKQPEVLGFLVMETKIEINAINANNMTALDMISAKHERDQREDKILHHLKQARALPASSWALSTEAEKIKKMKDPRNWSNKHYDAVMVVASLIASLAFQVGINPPGGTWQDFNNRHVLPSHKIIYGIPGTSIYSDIYPGVYKHMQISNGVALISSLSVILLLLSRFRYNKYFPTILMVFMWIALSATTYTYLIAAFFVSHKAFRVNARAYRWIVHNTWKWVAGVVALFLSCLLVDHAVLVINKVARSIAQLLKHSNCCRNGNY